MFPRGKTPAAPRPSDFRWETFAKDVSLPGVVGSTALPTHPKVFGHGLLYTDWGMYGNGPDESVAPGFAGAGDCVLAGAGHEVRMENRVVRGVELPITGKEAIQGYSEVTGYVLGDSSTDHGTDMGNAAEWRRTKGFPDANGDRHTIAAWVRLQPGNFDQLIEAVYIFLAAGIGFEFPNSAWQQFQAGEAWDYDPNLDNTIDGGHYVSRVGSIRVVSWGQRREMTKAFYEKFNDETIVYLSAEELRSGATDVHGFDLEKLQAYLALVGK